MTRVHRPVLLAALVAAAAAGGCGSGGTPARQADATTATAARPPTATTPRPARPALPAGWRGGAAAARARVPILMYHVVGHPAAGTAQTGLVTRPAVFARQIRALKRAGYTGVTLTQVLRAWSRAPAAGLPRRPVVVTFDDGYLGHVRYAAPVLRRAGWPAVLDLEVHNIGPRGLPAWGVRRLVRSGWELASHTIDHPDLTTLPDAALRDQLVRSRRELRRRFGVPVTAFCYPAGKFDARVQAAVRAAGYRAATTELPGRAAPDGDRTALPRIRADGDLDPAQLLIQIRAAR